MYTLNKIKIQILLIGVTLFSYCTLLTFNFVPKWDMIDISFPWRYYICECIQNNELPLWNPYQFLGFAQHTDLQTWYLPIWIIGLFSEYTIYHLVIEYVLHICIAALGMFLLANLILKNNKISFLIAYSYVFSGFFIGNSQHFGWIISAAWLPFVILSFMHLLKGDNIKWILSFSLFLNLLFTGGYIAFFITSIYILIVITIIFIIKNKKKYHYSRIIKRILKIFISFIVFILISLPAIFSAYDSLDDISRGVGLSSTQVLQGSLYFKNLITALFPALSYFKNAEFWHTDQSMMNIYIGIIPIIVLSVRFFMKKQKYEIFFIISAVFFLLLSLGDQIPLRKLLYYILPFFDYFRFPALFRLFFIISVLFLVGLYLKKIIITDNYFHKFKIIVLIYIGVLFVLLIFVFMNFESSDIKYSNIFTTNSNLGFYESLGINVVVQFIILILFFVVLKFNKHQRLQFIIFFAVVELMVTSFINQPLSVLSNNKASTIHEKIKMMPHGFPKPDLNVKIIDNSDKGIGFQNLWRNINTFQKKFAHDGFTPYQYNDFLLLEESKLYKEILSNPLLYFGEDYLSHEDSIRNLQSTKIVICTNSLDNYLNKPNQYLIDILEYTPNDISLETYVDKNSVLVYAQNYIDGWKAELNGKPIEIHKVNYSLIGIPVQAGKNIIRIYYKPNYIKPSICISFIFLVVLIIYLILDKIYSKKRNVL